MVMRKERVIQQKISPRSYTRRLRVEDKICPQYGDKFEGVKKQVFCSAACRSRADYQKHADSRREARMKRYRQEKRKGQPG